MPNTKGRVKKLKNNSGKGKIILKTFVITGCPYYIIQDGGEGVLQLQVTMIQL